MQDSTFPVPQSEYYWVTIKHGKIRSKVLHADEKENVIVLRPTSEEDLRLGDDITYNRMRTLSIQIFKVQYEKVN